MTSRSDVKVDSLVWVPDTRDYQYLVPAPVRLTDYATNESRQVQLVDRTRKGYLGLPRAHALKSISQFADNTVWNQPRKYPATPAPRDYQIDFIDAILAQCVTGVSDFIAQAATGKGKTVCALCVVATLKQNLLVVVDQTNIADQWADRAKTFLKISDSDICMYKAGRQLGGKRIVIATVQTLMRLPSDDPVFRFAGVAVFDESHVIGAEVFSRTLSMVASRVRFGLSATPNRKDALQKVITVHIGKVRALLTDSHSPSLVYVIENHSVYSYRANAAKMAGRFIQEVEEDDARLLMAAKAIVWLRKSGRRVLALSDRISQLTALKHMLIAMGVEKADVGIAAKQYTTYSILKDPKPARLPTGAERDAEFSPVHLSEVQKTTPKAQRAEAVDKCGIILASYRMFEKAVDVPSLSGGIELTPRADTTQAIGRVLRHDNAKLIPIWVTFADVNSFRSLHQLAERVKSYTDSNAEIYLWQPEQNRRLLLDPARVLTTAKSRSSDLRHVWTEISRDGTVTLPIASMLTKQETLLGSGTDR